MTDVGTMAHAESRRAHTHGASPPAVRLPKVMQGILFMTVRRRVMGRWIKQHGRTFEMNLPFFGRCVVVTDPSLARSVCIASAEQLVNARPNMSNLFGPGSVFALDGAAHRDRRRVLAPAFHGRNLRSCERFIEAETLRESAKWPEGAEFRILEPMNRIALNVILHIIFGDAGDVLDELRRIIPPYMKFGQRLAFVPPPPPLVRRFTPWRRLDAFRKAFDRVVFSLIDSALADAGLSERTDVLALLLRSRYEDGSRLSPSDICDEVLTLIGAGHETVASALGWVFERLRRHPDVLAELIRELHDGGADFRRATIFEALRSRTVIDVAARRVKATNFDLGGWRVPADRTVLVRITGLHESSETHARPERFDPHRFDVEKPAAPAWLPFGAGTRRCLGADFAIAEMDVVLRTVLQHFQIRTDNAADEKSHFLGVAHAPKLGGLITVNRRTEAHA